MSESRSRRAAVGLSRYGQLAAQLRQCILDGSWAPGQSLPSEAKLAQSHGVALGTLRQAVSVLVDEGLLSREHGRGTFVREGMAGASMLRFFRFRSRVAETAVPDSLILARRERRATAVERRVLELPSNSKVLTLQRLRSLDGRPCLLEHIVLPLPRFEVLQEGSTLDWSPLLYPMYEQRCGVLVARAQDELAIVRLSADEAEKLQLPAHAPAVRVARQAHDRSGACVECRTTLGDAFSFSYAAEVR